jgi:glycosyltransferase involved in cell wall biosynthesis
LFSVCPSEWYEVLGFTVVEAMLLSKPVIGSRIGAIPELVLDGVTGLTFEAGNSNDLRDKIAGLARDSASIKKYSAKAKDHVSRLVDYDVHYAGLTDLFTSMGLQI